MNAEQIEEIIERKVEERVNQRLEELEKDGSNISESEDSCIDIDTKQDSSQSKLSRRNFLKTVGFGAGTLAMLSSGAAWFSVGDSIGSGGGGGSSTLSDVLSQGNDISGNDIVDGGTIVWDTSASHIPAPQIQQGDGSGLVSDQVAGSDGVNHSAGSIPRFSDSSTGLSNTSEGDLFYNNADNSLYLNDGT